MCKQVALVASAATIELQATGSLKSVAEAINGQDESARNRLLPGSYQVVASYSGDAMYGPATGSAHSIVGPKCSLSSLAISNPLT